MKQSFSNHSDEVKVVQQQAYMRGQFSFYGIQSPQRREIQKPYYDELKPFLADHKKEIIENLWKQDKRDFQLFAIDLLVTFPKITTKDDFDIYIFMSTHKSWWDTVDITSTKLFGTYLRNNPSEIETAFKALVSSDNMWLRRTSIIFQLLYKEKTDCKKLTKAIMCNVESDEFFLQKAIGWSLRQYAKTNEQWVLDFVSNNPLKPLSKREALKNIKS